MIKPGATLTIRRLPLSSIQVAEYQERHMSQLLFYMELQKDHPDEDPGLLSVLPSPSHRGMYTLLDGHHRFLARVMTGHEDALCVIIVEEERKHPCS